MRAQFVVLYQVNVCLALSYLNFVEAVKSSEVTYYVPRYPPQPQLSVGTFTYHKLYHQQLFFMGENIDDDDEGRALYTLISHTVTL